MFACMSIVSRMRGLWQHEFVEAEDRKQGCVGTAKVMSRGGKRQSVETGEETSERNLLIKKDERRGLEKYLQVACLHEMKIFSPINCKGGARVGHDGNLLLLLPSRSMQDGQTAGRRLPGNKG